MNVHKPSASETAPVPSSTPDKEAAVRVRDLHVRYGPIKALQGVSLDVRKGELTALVGANGAGKSSLLHAIVGLVPAASGRIEVPAGKDVTRVPSHARIHRHGIGLVPEDRGILTQMTTEENLLMGLRVGIARRNWPHDEREFRLREVLSLFPPLQGRLSVGAGLLSGGEQQMLAIARALLMDPDVLLVDEPSTGLAPLVVRDIFARLRQLLELRELTIFLVEQNTEIALSLASAAYVLERGQIVLSGPAREVASDPRLHSAYLSR